MENESASLEASPPKPHDECLWLYSSGSTGRPKGVVHRHCDIAITCVHYAVDSLDMNDICFSAAKLFFAYGVGNAMTFPLWAGATAVLSDELPSPEMTFDLIERLKPTLYAAQLRYLAETKRDLSSIRACVSAGEALPADILSRWKDETGLIILDGIGSTELSHIFISNRPDDYRPGTSDRKVPGHEPTLAVLPGR